MNSRYVCLFGLVLMLSAYGGVAAAPQAQPGDVGLRHDLQVLADYGAISTPLTTWPISWDAVLLDLERVQAMDIVLPNRVLPTYERVLAKARHAASRSKPQLKVGAAGADKPAMIRGFSNSPREDAELAAGFSWSGDTVFVDLHVSGVDEPSDGKDVRADGSQVGLDIGNWSVAASTLDRWWGPGWDGSLILSNNARPIPALTVGRNLTTAPQARWLRWLGPWDLEMVWGQLDDERAIPDTRFFGMRVNFRLPGNVELGLSRTAQWCGEGRPCGADIFWDLFVGKDNIGDAGTTLENEPGNQMAGLDVRWTNHWFGAPVSVYGQFIGEDEAGGFPSRYLAQLGLEGSYIARNQVSYRWFAEAAATSCDALKSDVLYGCGYRQAIYQSGYTYHGRIIGHGLDNDARVISTGLVAVTEAGNTWQVLARFGDLNRVGTDPNHSVAVEPQDLVSLDIQHTRATRIGRLDIGLGHERREMTATGEQFDETRAFLRWTSRPWGR